MFNDNGDHISRAHSGDEEADEEEEEEEEEEEDGDEDGDSDDDAEGEEDEDDEDDDEDGGSGGARQNMLSFMFGNVGDDLALQEDYLDEDARAHLGALGNQLGGSLFALQQEVSLPQKGRQRLTPSDESKVEFSVEKAEDAVDYEDIDEEIEEEEDRKGNDAEVVVPEPSFYAEAALAVGARLTSDHRQVLPVGIDDEDNYDEEEDKGKETVEVEAEQAQHVDDFSLVLWRFGSQRLEQDAGAVGDSKGGETGQMHKDSEVLAKLLEEDEDEEAGDHIDLNAEVGYLRELLLGDGPDGHENDMAGVPALLSKEGAVGMGHYPTASGLLLSDSFPLDSQSSKADQAEKGAIETGGAGLVQDPGTLRQKSGTFMSGTKDDPDVGTLLFGVLNLEPAVGEESSKPGEQMLFGYQTDLEKGLVNGELEGEEALPDLHEEDQIVSDRMPSDVEMGEGEGEAEVRISLDGRETGEEVEARLDADAAAGTSDEEQAARVEEREDMDEDIEGGAKVDKDILRDGQKEDSKEEVEKGVGVVAELGAQVEKQIEGDESETQKEAQDKSVSGVSMEEKEKEEARGGLMHARTGNEQSTQEEEEDFEDDRQGSWRPFFLPDDATPSPTPSPEPERGRVGEFLGDLDEEERQEDRAEELEAEVERELANAVKEEEEGSERGVDDVEAALKEVEEELEAGGTEGEEAAQAADKGSPKQVLAPDPYGNIVMPVLFEEDGKQVLRFSELFGVNIPFWALGVKPRQKRRVDIDVRQVEGDSRSDIDEEEAHHVAPEAAIKQLAEMELQREELRGYGEESTDDDEEEEQGASTSVDSEEEECADEEQNEEAGMVSMETQREIERMQGRKKNERRGRPKGRRRARFVMGQPMKVEQDAMDWCVKKLARVVSIIPEANFEPLHLQEWEADIIWEQDQRDWHGKKHDGNYCHQDSDGLHEATMDRSLRELFSRKVRRMIGERWGTWNSCNSNRELGDEKHDDEDGEKDECAHGLGGHVVVEGEWEEEDLAGVKEWKRPVVLEPLGKELPPLRMDGDDGEDEELVFNGHIDWMSAGAWTAAPVDQAGKEKDPLMRNLNGRPEEDGSLFRVTTSEGGRIAGMEAVEGVARKSIGASSMGFMRSESSGEERNELIGKDAAEAEGRGRGGGREVELSGTLKRADKEGQGLRKQNLELESGEWLKDVEWEGLDDNKWEAGDTNGEMRPRTILDLNDPNMVFEVDSTASAYERILSRAAALIVVTPPCEVAGERGGPGAAGGASSPSAAAGGSFAAAENAAAANMGHVSPPLKVSFNVSNDKFYQKPAKKKGHGKRNHVQGQRILHALPALKLQTSKPNLLLKEVANFHRPRVIWYPQKTVTAGQEVGRKEEEKTRGPVIGAMRVVIKSLGGKATTCHINGSDTSAALKSKVKGKWTDLKREPFKLFFSGKELDDSRTLAEQSVMPESIVYLVCTKVHLLPKAQKLPGENKPRRPPAAFKKKSELSAKDGHILLMEYAEERPLLLSNVGMGARLAMYYRKTSPTDNGHRAVEAEGGPFIGTVIPLEPEDHSPFLGDVPPGETVGSLETNLYRAPAFQHKVGPSDYLLVRSTKGKLSLRRIDCMHAIGQQEPLVEVMTPGSKIATNFATLRMQAYVYREFRANMKPNQQHLRIRASDLQAQFPGQSDSIIRKRLKHCADFQRGSGGGDGSGWWVMKPGFRLPSEDELRRMITPETVCQFESMKAGQQHLKRGGIKHLTSHVGLTMAIHQLPDEAIILAAATHIERELQLAPWNLSANFIAAAQGRGTLEYTGVADPTGRGLGFSYLRVVPKPAQGALVEKKAAAARGGGTVTGTDADLRRLSMDGARQVLRKFGVPDEQIEGLTRWHRIAMVRKLSSEQAAGSRGSSAVTLHKFARGTRMSMMQQEQQRREKCQEVWDRQLQSLATIEERPGEGEDRDSDAEGSDLDSFGRDLENLLDAEEGEEVDKGGVGGKDKGAGGSGWRERSEGGGGVAGVRGLAARRRALQLQQEQVMEDEEAEAAALRRMLREDDEAEEQRKKKALKEKEKHKREGASEGPPPASKVAREEQGAAASVKSAAAAAAGVSSVITRGTTTLPIAAAPPDGAKLGSVPEKKKKTRLTIKSRRRQPDGTFQETVMHITDPVEIQNYLARKEAMGPKGRALGRIGGRKLLPKLTGDQSAGSRLATGTTDTKQAGKAKTGWMMGSGGVGVPQGTIVPKVRPVKVKLVGRKVGPAGVAEEKEHSKVNIIRIKDKLASGGDHKGKLRAAAAPDHEGDHDLANELAMEPQAVPRMIVKRPVPGKKVVKKVFGVSGNEDEIRRKEKKIKTLGSTEKGSKAVGDETGNAKKMVCGACGQKGHMRTKKSCPFYRGEDDSSAPLGHPEGAIASRLLEVEGTKIKLHTKKLESSHQHQQHRLAVGAESPEAPAAEAAAGRGGGGGGDGGGFFGPSPNKQGGGFVNENQRHSLRGSADLGSENLQNSKQLQGSAAFNERQQTAASETVTTPLQKVVISVPKREGSQQQKNQGSPSGAVRKIPKVPLVNPVRVSSPHGGRAAGDDASRSPPYKTPLKVVKKVKYMHLDSTHGHQSQQRKGGDSGGDHVRFRVGGGQGETTTPVQPSVTPMGTGGTKLKVLLRVPTLPSATKETHPGGGAARAWGGSAPGSAGGGKGGMAVAGSAASHRGPGHLSSVSPVGKRSKGKLSSGKKKGVKRAGSGDNGASGNHYGHTASTAKRRRVAPKVELANILENVVDTLKRADEAFLFLRPVTKKDAPDYLDYIDRPMDLGTIRDKVKAYLYARREEFRSDILQIRKNAYIYNRVRNPHIPPLADALVEICDAELEKRHEELTEAESAVRAIYFNDGE